MFVERQVSEEHDFCADCHLGERVETLVLLDPLLRTRQLMRVFCNECRDVQVGVHGYRMDGSASAELIAFASVHVWQEALYGNVVPLLYLQVNFFLVGVVKPILFGST